MNVAIWRTHVLAGGERRGQSLPHANDRPQSGHSGGRAKVKTASTPAAIRRTPGDREPPVVPPASAFADEQRGSVFVQAGLAAARLRTKARRTLQNSAVAVNRGKWPLPSKTCSVASGSDDAVNSAAANETSRSSAPCVTKASPLKSESRGFRFGGFCDSPLSEVDHGQELFIRFA